MINIKNKCRGKNNFVNGSFESLTFMKDCLIFTAWFRFLTVTGRDQIFIAATLGFIQKGHVLNISATEMKANHKAAG